MLSDERKCFRKGGRRKLENPYGDLGEPGFIPKKRASQFAMFAALRGYDEALEEARLDAEVKFRDK